MERIEVDIATGHMTRITSPDVVYAPADEPSMAAVPTVDFSGILSRIADIQDRMSALASMVNTLIVTGATP